MASAWIRVRDSPAGSCASIRVCENDALCASCGKPVDDRKLNANYFRNGEIMHTPGFCASRHRCDEPVRQPRAPNANLTTSPARSGCRGSVRAGADQRARGRRAENGQGESDPERKGDRQTAADLRSQQAPGTSVPGRQLPRHRPPDGRYDGSMVAGCGGECLRLIHDWKSTASDRTAWKRSRKSLSVGATGISPES